MTTAVLPFAYEFRFFAPDLTHELGTLTQHGVANVPVDTNESYLVSRLTIDASVKIRAGRIEIKELTERTGVLEGWARAVAAELPVSGEFFMTEAAVRLGAHLDVEKERMLSEQDILQIASSYHGLTLAAVAKRRTIFDLDQCRGEFTSITLGEHQADSIAIDGREAAAVLGKINTLGFHERLNESYPCYLQRLVFYPEAAEP
ncbi:MAG: hypothetical protein WC807_00760 [Hyphomicrobium sp.]|jgi:hypothetical protein